MIRHRLWAINDDQGRMAARLSGSFIVYEGYDFNAALMTADGRGLYCGVYILHHGATIDEFVRRILARVAGRGDPRGRHVLHQRPVVGRAARQRRDPRDADLLGGRLVAWSGIVMHDDDVGSPVPGQLRDAARADRFGEAPLFPAIKMVEGFEPRVDVERAYLRNSRTPEHNALNMRARVAALRMTHQRIGELIERVRRSRRSCAAQEGILDYVERVVRARLREIPDGSWFAQGYHDHDGINDRDLPDLLPADQERRPARVRPDRDRAAGARPDQLRAPGDGGRDHGRDPDVPLLRPAVGDRRRCGGSSRSSPRRARSTTR